MSIPSPADGRAALDLREIAVTYGGIRAVDRVSFSIPPGTILGLIGPNGAGKTTLLDAISGFIELDGGRIFLSGNDITDLPASERARAGLGRSFQDARLFPSLTVAEALATALERHTKAQDPVSTALGLPWVWGAEHLVRSRVEELIGLLGLRAFRDKFISELSTGSRRIVDLACVLAHEPSVLLLDEPSSGIAQKETEALGPLLVRIKDATGCTMILVEHDMPLVTAISDELIALETGRMIARGAPSEVTRDARVIEAYLGTDQRVIARSGTLAEALDVPGPPPVPPNSKKSRTRTKAKARAKPPTRSKPAKKRK